MTAFGDFDIEFPQPIFVIGCMRSGTSFFSSVIGEHPNVILISDYLNSIQRRFSDICGMPCNDPEKGCPYLDEKDIIPKNVLNLGATLSALIIREKKIRSYLNRLRFRIRTGSGGVSKKWNVNTRLLIKSTHFLNKIRYLNKIFPKATYILIIRDIYSHSFGMKRHFEEMFQRRGDRYYFEREGKSCWIRKSNEVIDGNYFNALNDFSVIPQMHIRLNGLALEDLQAVAPKRFIIVKYEALVQNTPREISKVWEFSGLPQRKIKTKSRKIFNSHTGDPIKAWKQGLTIEEKKSVEEALATSSAYSQILADCQ